jgi:hypothetical protein
MILISVVLLILVALNFYTMIEKINHLEEEILRNRKYIEDCFAATLDVMKGWYDLLDSDIKKIKEKIK